MSEGGRGFGLWEHHLYHLTGHMLSWQCSNRCLMSEGGEVLVWGVATLMSVQLVKWVWLCDQRESHHPVVYAGKLEY